MIRTKASAGAANGNVGVSLDQRLNAPVAPLSALATYIMQSLRVAVPAVVNSFDPAAGTVSVQVAIQERVLLSQLGIPGSPVIINPETQNQAIAILEDVPIQIPGGGGWSMTFPIQSGDECYVLFSDTSLDDWFQNGATVTNPALQVSQRRHSLSDGIAIFGLRSTPKAIQNYSTTAVQIRNNDQTVQIELAEDHVDIIAPTTINVTSDTVNITGSTTINIAGADTTKIDGLIFRDHVHGGVAVGASLTLGPQ